MDPKELDQQMDALMKRLADKFAVHANPYSADPLASDHLILNRSWDFFKKRIAAIEKQWQDITGAKGEEIRLLKKELDQLQNQRHQLHSEKIALEETLGGFRQTRLEDFRQFKKQVDDLKLAWGEERVALEMQVREAEQIRAMKETELKDQAKLFADRISQLKSAQGAMWKEKTEAAESDRNFQMTIQNLMKEKDDLVAELMNKQDLLRREVERRQQLVEEIRSELVKSGVKENELQGLVDQLRTELLRNQEEISLLKKNVEDEKLSRANLLQDWQREKSEWRELWDRARDVWGKKQS